MARGTARFLAAALLWFGVWMATPPEAQGHAALRLSSPADGEVFDEPPDSVTLSFTEPPELSLSVVEVVGVDGRSFHRGPLEVIAPDRLTISQPLAALPDGTYTTTWKVISQIDGHTSAGAFAFGVGVSALEAPPTAARRPGGDAAPLSPLEVVGRWLLVAGLVILVGSTATAVAAFGEPPGAVRWLARGGWGVSVAGLGVLALAQRSAAGVGFGALAGTSVGRALGWRAAAILAAGAALAAASFGGDRRRRAMTVVAAVAGGAAMLAEAWAGHAAAAQSLRLTKVVAQWAHLAAVGVWVGGLAALLLGVRGAASERKGMAVRRFSMLAGVALAVVAMTGVYRAVNEVDSWGSLFSTAYGRGVVVKTGLLAALVGLGAVNRYRNVPRAHRTLSGLRRVSVAELGLAAAALAAAALLAALPPPRSIVAVPASATRPGSLRVTGSDAAAAIRVRLEVDPGLSGSNRFLARISDYDSRKPVEDAMVTLVFSYAEAADAPPSSLELQPRQPGTYETSGAALSLDGRWDVTARVQLDGELLEVPFEIATRCRAQVFLEGPPTIYELAAPKGSIQGYVEPGMQGSNEIHFTYVDEAGIEIPIEGEATITASRPDEEPADVRSRRLSPGHLVSKAELGPGRWRFEIAAGDGALRGCFEESVR